MQKLINKTNNALRETGSEWRKVFKLKNKKKEKR